MALFEGPVDKAAHDAGRQQFRDNASIVEVLAACTVDEMTDPDNGEVKAASRFFGFIDGLLDQVRGITR